MSAVQNELMHYGVLGMKWGRRNSSDESTNKGRAKSIERKMQNVSGKQVYKSSIIKSVEKDVKATSEFQQYRKSASETWKKYLEASDKAENDYDRTVSKIHRDPKFKDDVKKMEKQALEQFPDKSSRGYQKSMEYGIDALEGDHPLYKDYQKRSSEVSNLAKEAYTSSENFGKALLGKYANKKVSNINQYDATAKTIVSDIVSSQMMSDYYDALYSK